ncbi:MAG: AI-2E family transporter [Cyanobacteria bacterium J06642_2]
MTLAQWLGLIAIGIVMYLLWQVKTLLLLMFAAVVLAVALDALARLLMRLHLGRTRQQAIALAIVTVGVLTFTLGLLVIPPLVEQFGTFVNLIPIALNRIEILIDGAIQRLPTDIRLPSLNELFDTLFRTLSPQITDLISQSLQIFRTSLSAAIGIFLFIILTILLLLDPPAYTEAFVSIFPDFYRNRIRYILQRCNASLRGWVMGALINSAFIGVLSGIGLWLLGIPLVLANAAIAGILNFIPNIGPTLSVIPPIVVALTVAPWKVSLVVLLYFILQQVESGLLTPYVMSRQVSLLPGFILLAQLLFATFFGFLGLFLALPLAAVLQVWIQEVVIRDVMDRWRDCEPDRPSDLDAQVASHSREELVGSGDRLAAGPKVPLPSTASEVRKRDIPLPEGETPTSQVMELPGESHP